MSAIHASGVRPPQHRRGGKTAAAHRGEIAEGRSAVDGTCSTGVMSTEDVNADLERLATKVWPEVIDLIDTLVQRAERMGEWSTRPRSALAGDDRKSAPFQTSHAIQMLLNAGIDSLNGVRHLIFGRPDVEFTQPVVHQAAHYVLARAAIENFSTALWILGPDARGARVERTLRWHVKNVADQHSALDRFPVVASRNQEQKLQHLEDLARAATGQVPDHFRKGYFASTVVRYVDESNPSSDELLSTHFIWQLCSGFAHGRPWAHLAFLDREEHPTRQADVLHARLTSDLHRSLLAPKHALHLCERLLRRHSILNTPSFDF